MSNRLSPLPGTVHYLADEIHYRYDNSLAPALTIDAGDTVTFVCREACDGQFTRESTTEVLDHLDCRHTGKGCTVYFPVKVPGALFSTGDGHLAQGDGEVAGIAMEAPLDVTMRLSLIKGVEIPAARFETSGPTTSKVDGSGHYVTCGTGPDLHKSVEDAVRLMVDTLERDRGFDRADAYIICSVAGDLKIAVPVLGEGHASHVTFHMPKSIFD